MGILISLDAGRRDPHDVEHRVLRIREAALPGAEFAGTRYVDGRIVGFVVASDADPAAVRAAAAVAVAEEAVLSVGDGRPQEGRLFHFPGQPGLHGALTVRQVLESSAIDRVQGVGALVDEDTVVVTHDFVRPMLHGGEIVLYVTPMADGSFEPFELENPHRCCEAD
jgi:hypothetical protein